MNLSVNVEQTLKGSERDQRITVTPTGAFPHAHQPGAAGVCLPGVSHAAGDPLHGRPRV